MSWFDRFTSQKGKKEKAVKPAKVGADKKTSAADQEKKIFAAVGAGKKEAKPAKSSPEQPKSETAKKAPAKTSTDRAGRILMHAVVTEKSTRLAQQNQYVFAIAPSATKVDVRHAVQHVYGIRPTAVAIVRLPGKDVRYGRTLGRTPLRKKAIVTLPAGKTIDLTVS